jgi:tetratricopeptide repeat protein
VAEVPADVVLPEDESDVFAPSEPAPAAAANDLTDTLTMADIYVRQGLLDEARNIYEHILARDPENGVVREKLAALQPPPPAAVANANAAKIARLEDWLARVTRKEVGRV